ncbi:BZ3500_MvSof-1268-A1-R1_Chr1-3g02455 [Microbotryum saponariae]|uniref:GPI ethanolamine phosphate transferase 1 n=1 Tax=Microbotryum saponariae TaxID=289078 RepID=A0A2X0KCD5_9BASI|nr:BZ3500_MvSof-1268-A1-R1_Chr1-3g02455 [Microbotryum saponariae]SCZ96279.1 BZ3501_MvSof-1269-A2-R1_Chr1-3g02058 [Microbotryum saponariae]
MLSTRSRAAHSSRNRSHRQDRDIDSTASPSSRSTRFGGSASLLLLSILFHTIYLNSIFDVYFVSPVTKGVGLRYGVGAEHENGGPGARVGEKLAKRVVLIVGDGLRADKLFQIYNSPPFDQDLPLPSPLQDVPHTYAVPPYTNWTTPAPFVRNLIQSGQARWGVSHTRVPTESRPGHVALIGGMYEDVSAVTRGWQTNPVKFDSVFNQSSHAFTFGSPDILPMFAQGASDPTRVDAFSYGEEHEDFSKDAVHLDLWVLDQLKTLLKNSTTNPKLDQQLKADGVVIFLHLLGLDTTGHSYRPHGPEYHRNIRVVDHVISETARLLEDFYDDDGETAFVFTADHGMSSIGNHGDGEPDNTRTPLVVWGKGVASGLVEDEGNDDYSRHWDLRGERLDVDQADVAVLMSVLGGLAIPANSAGRIPLKYLSADPSFKARACFANAKQVLAEFEERSRAWLSKSRSVPAYTDAVLEDLAGFKQAHALAFKPFPELVDDASSGKLSVESHKRQINALIHAGDYEEATAWSMELVNLGFEGLRYFRTYDWLVLRTIVALGYLGFIVYSANFVLRTHVYSSDAEMATTTTSPIPRVLGAIIFSILSTKFFIERSSATYYAYAAFPCYFWSSILSNRAPLIRLFRSISPVRAATGLGATLIVVQMIAQAYLVREYLTYILVTIALAWPLLGMDRTFRRKEQRLVTAWAASCSLLSIFPQLPVEKGENLTIVYAGAVAMFILGLVGREVLEREEVKQATNPSSTIRATHKWLALQIGLILLSLVPTVKSALALQRKQGLPLWSQSLGWIVLVGSVLVPIIRGRPRQQPFLERLLIVLFAFGPSFNILSLSYEGLFYACFCATLCLWLLLERRIALTRRMNVKDHEESPKINGGHIRMAVFFLTFLHLAFFGVGNVASISSFYLEPVYRLIPVFNPFAMALLLLFKLLSPFVALSAITSVLNKQLGLPPFSLFIIASTLSDVLTINFFFRVTDQGSWLEIGSTITNFAISSLLCIFNTALYLGGEFLLANTEVNSRPLEVVRHQDDVKEIDVVDRGRISPLGNDSGSMSKRTTRASSATAKDD